MTAIPVPLLLALLVLLAPPALSVQAIGEFQPPAAAGRAGPFHQRGEPTVVSIVTATTGKSQLARAIESVRRQDYAAPIQHLILVDGPDFEAPVRAILAGLEHPPTTAPYVRCPEAPHVRNSPCAEDPDSAAAVAAADSDDAAAASAGWGGARWLDVVYLPFNMHGDGGRVYNAGPNLARGEFVGNLDEDNYYDPTVWCLAVPPVPPPSVPPVQLRSVDTDA
jgi:hypothetical protein|eukprot:SAG25_NODE_761_length_5514_cov_23.676822_7_plen_222_part_00